MSASVNKCLIIGNTTRDPEVRYTPSGSAVCNLSVATNRAWKNKETGEKQEEVEFHRVVFYDRLAEIAGEYLKKGRSVYVEGRLKTRKWQDKDGAEKYTTEIVAEEMKMLGGREGGDAPAEQSAGSNAYAQAKGRPTGPSDRQARPGPAVKTGTGFDSMDDDIPFAASASECEFASPKARRMARCTFE